MSDKNEKERRRKILQNLKNAAKQEFEATLPMTRHQFKQLFDHLDTALNENECDDTFKLTETFLQQAGIVNIPQVKEWLKSNGGYCDCEILANVEEKFE